MNLYIKYMVSLRCKMMVKDELNKLGYSSSFIEQGKLTLEETISEDELVVLSKKLTRIGFELLDETQSEFIESIKTIVVKQVADPIISTSAEYTEYISKKLNRTPEEINDMFAEVHGMALSKYIAIQKVEFAKELLLFDKLTVTTVSSKLKYINAEKLTNEVKQVTGLPAVFYKKIGKKMEQITKAQNKK